MFNVELSLSESETLHDRLHWSDNKTILTLLIAFLNLCRSARSQKQTQSYPIQSFLNENEVSSCFEHNYNFSKRQKKPLMLPRTRRRQNHNLDKKMAGANYTPPNKKKSTAIVQHLLWVCSPSSYRPKCFWQFFLFFVPCLHNCLELFQPSSCLDEAM